MAFLTTRPSCSMPKENPQVGNVASLPVILLVSQSTCEVSSKKSSPKTIESQIAQVSPNSKVYQNHVSTATIPGIRLNVIVTKLGSRGKLTYRLDQISPAWIAIFISV